MQTRSYLKARNSRKTSLLPVWVIKKMQTRPCLNAGSTYSLGNAAAL